MIDDPDIFRAPRLLADLYGEGAAFRPGHRAEVIHWLLNEGIQL